MVKIIYADHSGTEREVDANIGESVMEAAVRNNIRALMLTVAARARARHAMSMWTLNFCRKPASRKLWNNPCSILLMAFRKTPVFLARSL